MSTNDYRALLVERFGSGTDDVLIGLGLDPDVDVAAVPWLCELLDAGIDLPLRSIPRPLGVRLRALIHEVDAPDRPKPSTALPVAVAHLQSDTRRERELVGVRGGTADSWTLLFRSEVADVVMGVSVVNSAELRIAGQVLVHDGNQRQFAAELVSAEGSSQPIHLRDTGDSFGRVNFDRVPIQQDQWKLVLSDGASDIVAALDLTDAPQETSADEPGKTAP